MLLPRPRSPPNERRILTFELDEKPGDRQTVKRLVSGCRWMKAGGHVITPKQAMPKAEILFYCLCIRANRYRYSYGRQANKTLENLMVPTFSSAPSWVNSTNLMPFVDVDEPLSLSAPAPSDAHTWAYFRYDRIFDIRKGYYNKKPPLSGPDAEGALPFIGATESSNGTTSYHRREDVAASGRNGEIDPDKSTARKIFAPGCITVSNNGSVGYAFYQPVEFTCSHDVNPLYLLAREMTPEIGMFLCTIIGMDRYRWGYGRKWRPMRMPNSIIKLPVVDDGEPGWEYMERYMRALPYSKTILEAA
ncbi:MAG: restriction endonuclease subunit S [Acidobacteriota bacterium]|nr:restriction endonuclease subunit S [Acidobacteriota bacterium]